ncbi:MAG: rRNA maturation RNase YbeY [Lysobacterales bacterium]
MTAGPSRIELAVQRATCWQPLPSDAQFKLWVRTALRGRAAAELTIRIVDREESRELNRQYRGKDAPTNVLSFPADLPKEVEVDLLGDILMCAPLVAEEALEQGKAEQAHWAHLTIHGVLHLLGHDHQETADAEVMEGIEIALLESLGIANPYG